MSAAPTIRQLEDALLARLFFAPGTAADVATAMRRCGRRSFNAPKIRRTWARLKAEGRLPWLRRGSRDFRLIAALLERAA